MVFLPSSLQAYFLMMAASCTDPWDGVQQLRSMAGTRTPLEYYTQFAGTAGTHLYGSLRHLHFTQEGQNPLSFTF